jgi:hypothetical protein
LLPLSEVIELLHAPTGRIRLTLAVNIECMVSPTGFEPVFEYDYDFALFFSVIEKLSVMESNETKTWVQKHTAHLLPMKSRRQHKKATSLVQGLA